MSLTKEQVQSALDAAKSLSLADFVGQTLVVLGFTLDDGQFGKYALIQAVTEDGEEVTINSGGKVILAQLAALDDVDAFKDKSGVEVLVTGTPTRYGNDLYRFEVA